MPLELTGHAEIDQHHSIIEGVLLALRNLETDCRLGPRGLNDATHGNVALQSLASELLAILTGHLAYEEKMMGLLPNAAGCQEHVFEHKASHGLVLGELKKLLHLIGKEAPELVAEKIYRMVGTWLGEHNEAFDIGLISEFGLSETPEVDFDEELVSMLDLHVFQGRPRAEKVSATTQHWQRRQKLALRGWIELLSPAQKTVFWHIVAGKKNREIAEQLGCSINTIKSHRAAIFQKMGVSSVLDLVKKTEVFG